MNMTSRLSRFLLWSAVWATAGIASAAQIEPPKVPVVDRNGVNMANGQVTRSQFTVAIGGAMGLSHSVSVHANEFKGFDGKYKGAGSNVELSLELDYAPRNVYRVYDFEETVDFAYMLGDAKGGSMQMQQGGGIVCTPLNQTFKFQSLGDERHTLECDATYLYWTKPDGTVARFLRSGYTVNSYAALVDVTFPSGFRITTSGNGFGATTNTGFQIKSFFEEDYRDFRCTAPARIPDCKDDITTLINTDPFFTSAASGWSSANPRYVKAINNAIEFCPVSARDCVLSKKWPAATFNWPAGMPRTLSIGNTLVSIVDMKGQRTWFDFKAYDLAFVTNQGGVLAQGKTQNREMSPRIVRIHSDGNDRDVAYDFENVYVTQGTDSTTWDIRLQNSGKIVSALLLGDAHTGYSIAQPYYNDAVSQSYGIGGIQRVQIKGSAIQGNPGAIYFVESDEGTLWRENTVTRNFPTQFVPGIGPTEDYEYTRSNLTKIVYRKNMRDMTYVQAFFPATCTSSTRKTCNQATSIRDARGNVTEYTYHEPSGGVYSVTQPADKNGRRAQTRYEYQQKSAHYFNGGAGKITGSPIWLKVSERFCINSNYTDNTADGNPLNGVCDGGDEVITRYEYNHDNLLLTGIAVISPPPNVVTLRTCFKYDIYGNQIGKTEPNANLASCS